MDHIPLVITGLLDITLRVPKWCKASWRELGNNSKHANEHLEFNFVTLSKEDVDLALVP